MSVSTSIHVTDLDAWPGGQAGPGMRPGTMDHEYNTRAWALDFSETLARHRRVGEAARNSPGALLAMPWGALPRQRMDLLLPNASHGPMVLYLHGGFWQFRSSGKEGGAFLAPEFLRHGIAYAGLSYELCPDVGMDQMIQQIREAVVWLVRRSPGLGFDIERLTLVGHSAGAHLATMAALTDWESLGLPRQIIAGVCGVSGIYDLRPLLKTRLNEALGMDEDIAKRCSPLLNAKPGMPPMILSCGERESAEFKRQTREFAQRCKALGVECRQFELKDRDHYCTIEDVVMVAHPLSEATLTLCTMGAEVS